MSTNIGISQLGIQNIGISQSSPFVRNTLSCRVTVENICTISDAGGNWHDTTTWVEGRVPSAQSHVKAQLDGTSGNLVLPDGDTNECYCRSFDMTGYTGTITDAGADYCALVVGADKPGDFIMSAAMDMDISGSVSFVSTTGPNNITSNGQHFGDVVYFRGIGGTWVFQDRFRGQIYHYAGTIDANGANVHAWSYRASNSSDIGPRVLNMGEGSWYITKDTTGYCWIAEDDSPNTLTINCETSSLFFSPAGIGEYQAVSLGEYTYNNIIISSDSYYIVRYGSPTIANLYVGDFVDRFDFMDYGRWYVNWNDIDHVSVNAGNLELSNLGEDEYVGMWLNRNGDLTSSYASIEIVDIGTDPTSFTSFALWPLYLWKDADNYIRWEIWQDGNIYVKTEIATVENWPWNATFNSSTHRHLRIRESGGTVYCDYSSDGISWTNAYSIAVASLFAVTSLEYDIVFDPDDSQTTTVKLDNAAFPMASKFTVDAGETVTAGNFVIGKGDAAHIVTLEGSDNDYSPGTAYFSQASGIVDCDFISVQNLDAIGGAKFYAGANSTNVLALSDDFDDNSFDTAKWAKSTSAPNSDILEQNQELEFIVDVGYDCSLNSQGRFDLNDSTFKLKIVDAVYATGSCIQIEMRTTDNANKLTWFIDQDGGQSDYAGISCAKKVTGTWYTMLWTAAYVAATYRYLRIRESNGTTYWEYSADDSNWTTAYSEATPIDISELEIKIWAVNFDAGATATFKIDDISLSGNAGWLWASLVDTDLTARVTTLLKNTKSLVSRLTTLNKSSTALVCRTNVFYTPASSDLVSRVTILIKDVNNLSNRLTILNESSKDLIFRILVSVNEEVSLISRLTVFRLGTVNLNNQVTVLNEATKDLISRLNVVYSQGSANLISRLTVLNKSVKALTVRVTTLREDYKNLISRINVLQTDSKSLISRLEVLIEAQRALTSRITVLLNSEANLISRVNTLRESSKDLTARLNVVYAQDSRSLEVRVRVLRQSSFSLVAQLTTLRQDILSLISSLTVRQNAVKFLQSRIEVRQISTRALQSRIIILRESSKNLVSKVTTLREDTKDIPARLTTLRESQSSLVTRLVVLRETQTDLVVRIKTLRESQSDLVSRLVVRREETQPGFVCRLIVRCFSTKSCVCKLTVSHNTYIEISSLIRPSISVDSYIVDNIEVSSLVRPSISLNSIINR